LTSKRLIPIVPLYTRYCEFKRGGPYRAQKARIELGKHYERAPQQLAAEFARSVEAFASYDNPGEALTGRTRKTLDHANPTAIANGREAAAYLELTLPGCEVRVDGLGIYTYVEREIVPARTTIKAPVMANVCDDGRRSTAAMKADLLLCSAAGNPTVGEVKVSTARGDDADPFYALVQALALAAQLTPASQRKRLRCQHEDAGFAAAGPLDVLVLLFRPAELAKATHRKTLTDLTVNICDSLRASGALRPYVEEIAVVEARAGEEIVFSTLPPDTRVGVHEDPS
jgi:hypothetical protein